MSKRKHQGKHSPVRKRVRPLDILLAARRTPDLIDRNVDDILSREESPFEGLSQDESQEAADTVASPSQGATSPAQGKASLEHVKATQEEASALDVLAATASQQTAATKGSSAPSQDTLSMSQDTLPPTQDTPGRDSLALTLPSDTIALLQTLPIDQVTSRLQSLTTSTGIDVLAYVKNPPGKSPAEAAQEMYNALGDHFEERYIQVALFTRWCEAEHIFETHPDKAMHDRETFLNSLDNREIARTAIAIGVTTILRRHGAAVAIDKAWGEGWLKRIPYHLLPPSQHGMTAARNGKRFERERDVSALPRRLLETIRAHAAKEPQEIAVARWQKEQEDRVDYKQRRLNNDRRSAYPWLMAVDVEASLSKMNEPEVVASSAPSPAPLQVSKVKSTQTTKSAPTVGKKSTPSAVAKSTVRQEQPRVSTSTIEEEAQPAVTATVNGYEDTSRQDDPQCHVQSFMEEWQRHMDALLSLRHQIRGCESCQSLLEDAFDNLDTHLHTQFKHAAGDVCKTIINES